MSKILIVDDDVNECFLLKCFLEEFVHDVIVSHNGIDAVKKVKNLKPDIMLLDLMMEGIDGMEVLRLVRFFDERICIVMVSGVMNEEIGKEAMKKGVNEYMTKPVDYNHLKEYILADFIKRSKE